MGNTYDVVVVDDLNSLSLSRYNFGTYGYIKIPF